MYLSLKPENMNEKSDAHRFLRSLRASLTRWLAQSPLTTMKNWNTIDASSLLGSNRNDGGSRLPRFGKSTSLSVLKSPSVMQETCGCDGSGHQESVARLGHDHYPTIKFSSRFQLDEVSNRSIRHPFRTRSSIGSKTTAVDTASITSRSPSSPSPSAYKLNTKLDPRSISPATYNSLSTSSCSDSRTVVYSRPPSQPPPNCPLPPLPVNHSPSPTSNSNSPSSFRSMASSLSSSAASSPLGRSLSTRFYRSSTPQNLPPRLRLPTTVREGHPSGFYRQALYHLENSFYDDDPFAAEQLVISPPTTRARPGWADDESVDPLGPVPYPSRPTSVYTAASESCYSVDTTVDRFAQVSLDVSAYSRMRPPDQAVLSAASRDSSMTPSIYSEDEEDRSESSVSPLERMAVPSPELSTSKCLSFAPSQSPTVDTFSFGLPSRFDGFFFGYHKRLDPKYHAGPAMVLEVTPPISATSFGPGDSLRVKICLASLFDNLIVSFVGESRLLGQRKLKSHRFLKHEIDLDRPGQWGSWQIQRGSSPKEWFVELKIPTLSNCDCGQRLDQLNSGGLELPSSTINSQIFISYHLIIRGIGKQKKADKPSSKKKKKAKGEEKVRLTVMIKNKLMHHSQPAREPVQAGHSDSCFSIE